MLEGSQLFHDFGPASRAVDHGFTIARNHAHFVPLHRRRFRSAVCYAVESYQGMEADMLVRLRV